jgi:glycosyltransferase involved in cell wall biosynthesis
VDVSTASGLLLLTPIMPAETGNGLAMRAGMQLRALSARYEVRVVVIPVSGGSSDTAWAERHASSVRVVRPDPVALRAGAARLMASAVWRERLQRSEPFPAAVKFASPALAAAVAEAAGAGSPRVHALRAYLAPVALAVAEHVGAPWRTLDLDDDDVHRLASEGSDDAARAYERLLATFGGEFAWVSLASAEDAARVTGRLGLRTTVVANAVAIPAEVGGRSQRAPGQRLLLLVGNLTYSPNIDAAERLVRELLPRVRRLVDETVAVEIVGRFEAGGPIEALAAEPGVTVRGYVDDLAAAYARADLAVVPLTEGSGTRIKLLEAFAAGVPVVTTPIGAAGLEVEDGRHLLLASDADALAAAVARVLSDAQLADDLACNARALAEQRFGAEVVGGQLRALMQELDEAPG